MYVTPWIKRTSSVLRKKNVLLRINRAAQHPPELIELQWRLFLPGQICKPVTRIQFVVTQELVHGEVKSLVPDFVTTLKMPPAARPYSALKLLVSTLNSWTESGFG